MKITYLTIPIFFLLLLHCQSNTSLCMYVNILKDGVGSGCVLSDRILLSLPKGRRNFLFHQL